MTNIIKAERAKIGLAEGLFVDGYRMPDGEFRVGITTASLAAGFAEDYLRKGLLESSPRFKALQSAGFEGKTLESTRVTKTGERTERTISLTDFSKLLRFADRQGKASAGAILDASVVTSFTDRFRDDFGLTPLTPEQRRDVFYSACAKGTNWIEEEKDEKLDLALGMAQWH